MRVGQSRSPPVVVRVVLLPQEPDFAGAFSKQILARETHGNGKSLCAFADAHDVAGVLHDRLGDARNILDVTNAAHGSRTARGSMHAAGVEFYNPLFVRKAAQSNGIIIRIIFWPFYNAQGGAGGFGGASRIVFNSVLNFVLRVQTSRIQASGERCSDCGT